MNVTRLGRDPRGRMWRGECRTCRSRAEAEQREMTHITDDPREGTQFSWEVCPVCKAGDNTGYGGMLFYPIKESTDG